MSEISHAEFSRFVQEAKEQRERAEAAENERDGFAAAVAEIRASMKDDKALCASIRGALQAVQDAHPGVPTTHSAAKRVAGALVNVLDNIVLRHVEHAAGHDIKTLCQEIWKLRHGGNPGQNLDRKTGASRGRAFVNLEKAHIRAKADLAAAEARAERAEVAVTEILAAADGLNRALLSCRFPAGDTPEQVEAQAKAAHAAWDRAVGMRSPGGEEPTP